MHSITALAHKRSLNWFSRRIPDGICWWICSFYTANGNVPFILVIRTLSPTWNIGDVVFRAFTLA